MTTQDSPITIGDLLLTQPKEEDAMYPDWMQQVLEKLPDAWLVEHHKAAVREIPEVGCRVITFIAPTEQNVRELAEAVFSAPKIEDSILSNGPAIYSLREVARLLIEKGYGAAIIPYSDDPERANDGVILTVGDLVKLVLEGVLTNSPTAHQWAPYVTLPEQPETPISTFLEREDEKLQLVRPPEEVIPSVLWKPLEKLLETEFPMLQLPALARNTSGQLALVFYSRIGATLDGAAEKLPKLNWLFPSHYHLLLVSRE